LRIVFLGTPEDAVPPLRALVDGGHEVAFVVTQPDRRRGRGGAAGPSSVKQAALDLSLPVRTPRRAREILDEVRTSGAALGVVVAFGQLLPDELLGALPHGFVNLHFSLLPRWRGAAPVERAVLAGDTETGVCVMRVDAGLDTGPVFAVRRTPIGADETAGELRTRLIELGTELLADVVPRVPDLQPAPQQGEPTYAEKLTVDEFRIDWRRPAEELRRLVRAGNPRPGAWTTLRQQRLKVLRARLASGDARPGTLLPGGRVATGGGALALDEVQPAGKRPMAMAEWVAGHTGPVVFGEP